MRCEALETQLVDLVVMALERCEKELDVVGVSMAGNVGDEVNPSQLHWQHLSSQLIFFVLFQFASFSHMVNALYEKVCVCMCLCVCVCVCVCVLCALPFCLLLSHGQHSL